MTSDPTVRANPAPDTRMVARRATDLTWTRVAEEVFVLDSAGGRYLNLNTSGAFIWEALKEPRAIEDLVARAAEAFEGDAGQIRAGLIDLLERLQSVGVVEIDA